jgi:anthranilate phosphoribosyltransferase
MIDWSRCFETVSRGGSLSAEEMTEVVGYLLDGELDTSSAGAEPVRRLLIALADRGETADELWGAARAMRAHMTPIRRGSSAESSGGAAGDAWKQTLLDTCGTGGSGSGTFNISTATAIVVSAGGVAVAKHGNRRATSRSGSADVLAELGLRLEAERGEVEHALETLQLCFCFAPRLHPAMRHVAAIRKSIPKPTLFNYLGPLCNPAGATHQLLGTGRADRQRVLAETLARLGTQRSAVVRGSDGQDEVTLDGETEVLLVGADGTIEALRWTPATFGLEPAGAAAMQAEHPAHSAEIIRRVFAGEPGPCRDIVVANAAAAFWLVERENDLDAGARLAEEILDSGAAAMQLRSFVALSGQAPADRESRV